MITKIKKDIMVSFHNKQGQKLTIVVAKLVQNIVVTKSAQNVI